MLQKKKTFVVFATKEIPVKYAHVTNFPYTY